MGLRRGMNAVRTAARENAERNDAMKANRTPEIRLVKSGQEAELWFVGSVEEEPVEVLMHGISLGKNKFTKAICAKSVGKKRCVCCKLEKSDKRIGPAKSHFVWNAVDTRYVHKRVNKEKTAAAGGKFEKFDWYDCKADGDEADGDVCKYCKKLKRYPRTPRGAGRLVLPPMHAESLCGTDDTMARNCIACGGKKTIVVKGWKNKVTKKFIGPEDIEDVDEEKRHKWVKVVKCRKCKDPTPANISLAPITMKRNGTGKSTSYTFSPGTMCDPPDWVTEQEVTDLTKLSAPSEEYLCKMLDVDNPFDEDGGKKGKDSSSYDDDEDGMEDDEDEEDDEEDDEDEDDDDEEDDDD